jgi:thioredoxin 1
MRVLADNEETGCCKRFDPAPWDRKELNFADRLFVKDHVISFFHIPINYGKVIKRNMEKIEAAGAKTERALLQIFHFSRIPFYTLCLMVVGLLVANCSRSQQPAQVTLSAHAAADTLKANPHAILLDVRTPEEFAKGHLPAAVNMDWNNPRIKAAFSELDKDSEYVVYCLSGGRSAAAAKYMRSAGFQKVYELDGGILAWRAADLPEAHEGEVNSGMTTSQFDSLVLSDKLVLVDFYAEWCAPCKKMKPYLEEIAATMASSVEVIRIDADEHTGLCKTLSISGLPVLHLYKDGKMIWTHTGYIGKEEVVKVLTK